MDRDEFVTETRAPQHADLDLRSTRELIELMNGEDSSVPAAVAGETEEIAAVVDELVERLGRGGRLILVGAGSSGRLAQAEAAECEATFSTPPGQVVAVVAGADADSSLAREAAEDDEDAGRRALASLRVTRDDAVVLVSAGGRSPFVLGAAGAAGAAGAFTACVVSVPESELAEYSDVTISAVVGPEILAGSTRLKAGTAQKLVLNTLSTVTMIRLGKTYAGLMVDVVPANEKLQARVRRIVAEATGASDDDVERALVDAGGEAKVAIVSLLADVDAQTARSRLAAAGGNVRLALVG
ncbi:MAG TPA: N-acetylmuramic acid 6-phosphate etherase [Gaiellaceae bacterium]